MCIIRSTIHWELSAVFPHYHKHSLVENYELGVVRLEKKELTAMNSETEKKTSALVNRAVLLGVMHFVSSKVLRVIIKYQTWQTLQSTLTHTWRHNSKQLQCNYDSFHSQRSVNSNKYRASQAYRASLNITLCEVSSLYKDCYYYYYYYYYISVQFHDISFRHASINSMVHSTHAIFGTTTHCK